MEKAELVPWPCPEASIRSVRPVAVGFTSSELAMIVRVSVVVVWSADSTMVTVRAPEFPVTDVGTAPSRPVQLVAVSAPLVTVHLPGNVSTISARSPPGRSA